MIGDQWAVCKNCTFKRHGSNSALLKRLHEENNLGHICEIITEGATSI